VCRGGSGIEEKIVDGSPRGEAEVEHVLCEFARHRCIYCLTSVDDEVCLSHRNSENNLILPCLLPSLLMWQQ